MSIFVAKNFKRAEFRCPCGCEKDRPINSKLLYLLQSLRNKIGEPIYITSGIRCKKYNKKVDGYRNSPHLTGQAVDCKTKKMSLIDFAIEARDIGFLRIGLYKTFIHIDVIRPYRSASWCRDKKGKYHYFKTLEESIAFAKKIGFWYN